VTATQVTDLGETHIYYPLVSPERWCMYVSTHDTTVTRLVVFVHGFNGKAVDTWRQFEQPDVNWSWWIQSDLLFVAYDSLRDSIVGVANRLRRLLPDFYPNNNLSPGQQREYEEIVVLAHSLGGVIVRRAVCDSVQLWLEAGSSGQKPVLVDAVIRLFSPAIAGYRLAGMPGLVKAFGGLSALEAFLRKSSAFIDLQPGSELLVSTRNRTESLAQARCESLESLRPAIVWASPDNVVIESRYETDKVDDSWDNTTHSSICKPVLRTFEKPWIFAETGRTSG